MLLLILGCSGVDDLRQEIEALETRVITLEKENYFYCTAIDNTPGVELWRECYSIENTTVLNFTITNNITNIDNQIPQYVSQIFGYMGECE